MNIDYYKQYEPLFGSWKIQNLIGEGSFGSVYQLERNEMGITYKAALKAISIPQNQSEVKSILSEGMSMTDVTAYYTGIVRDLLNEIVLMSKLKGTSNIVSYEDHILKEHENGVGWDILVRMELLTPLYDYLQTRSLTKRDVIKMGIHICRALELCQKHSIIHRDVKPENIFVSENGDFKLGDFGIARTLDKTTGGLSKKGTYTYMAPEIYRGEPYGPTVDIYSLGLVMYKMLNHNRTPFLPDHPQPITHNDKEMALLKRISGNPVPMPKNADGRLAEIVLKACSHDPKKRYGNAAEMRRALEALLNFTAEPSPASVGKDTTSAKKAHHTGNVGSSTDTYAAQHGNGKKAQQKVVNSSAEIPVSSPQKKSLGTAAAEKKEKKVGNTSAVVSAGNAQKQSMQTKPQNRNIASGNTNFSKEGTMPQEKRQMQWAVLFLVGVLLLVGILYFFSHPTYFYGPTEAHSVRETLQKAESGTRVYLKPGSYEFGKKLYIRESDVKIIGMGSSAESVVLRFARGHSGIQCKNGTLKNLKIVVKGDDVRAVKAIASKNQNNMDKTLTVKNCILRSEYRGVSSVRNLTVKNCDIRAPYGVYTSSAARKVTLAKNHIDSKRIGINVKEHYSGRQELRIKKNTIESDYVGIKRPRKSKLVRHSIKGNQVKAPTKRILY